MLLGCHVMLLISADYSKAVKCLAFVLNKLPSNWEDNFQIKTTLEQFKATHKLCNKPKRNVNSLTFSVEV